MLRIQLSQLPAAVNLQSALAVLLVMHLMLQFEICA